jgi:hypothetical protein
LAVDRRLSEMGELLAQDLIGTTEFTVPSFKLIDLGAFIARQSFASPRINLSAVDPSGKCLSGTSYFFGN